MKMIEPQKDLELVIKGQKVTIPKEDHYFTSDGNNPVIKHAPLKRLAAQFGVCVDRVELEFPPIMTPEGIPYVAHRAYGKNEQGIEISAIGEAGPYNLEGLATRFPVIMSNKRAEDRLLIALLGLEGVVYSESEISEEPTHTNGSSGSEPSEGQAATTQSDPSSTVFPFGKHKGKTLGEIALKDKQYLEWFAKNYKSRSLKDKQLIQAAKAVLAS